MAQLSEQNIDIYKISVQEISPDELACGVIRIQPVMGGELPAAEYFQHMVSYVSSHGDLIAPGELGCALSHISIYRRIVECGRGALILEADMNASGEQLTQARALCAKFGADFVHLGWHPKVLDGRGFYARRCGDDGLWQIDPRIGFVGAFAYYVSPSAARELLGFHEPYPRKADAWADFFRISSITPYFHGIFFHPLERGSLTTERRVAKAFRLRRLLVIGLRRWSREKFNRLLMRMLFRKVVMPAQSGW